MFRVMYTSSAIRDLRDEELEDILEKSRKNNLENNVTGLLIVKGRTFLQCLEGEKVDVMTIYNKILEDDRHINIIDLMEENIEERLFPEWSMGYKNIKYLTNYSSEKIKDFKDTSEFESSKEDILEVFKEFISSN